MRNLPAGSQSRRRDASLQSRLRHWPLCTRKRGKQPSDRATSMLQPSMQRWKAYLVRDTCYRSTPSMRLFCKRARARQLSAKHLLSHPASDGGSSLSRYHGARSFSIHTISVDSLRQHDGLDRVAPCCWPLTYNLAPARTPPCRRAAQ